MVGYAKSYSSEIAISDDNKTPISDIILKEDTQELDEVVIKAEKPLYEQTIDRMVINVQSSPIMAGNSVLEILEKSPGVIVNRQNSAVSMNGKNGVSVMINGKMTRMDMAALFAMLDGMPASNIEKLELITTPPANFDAEGNAGFINIVLKKNDYEGVNGSISTSVGYGRRERFMTSGNINYRKKKINVFADYSFNYAKHNFLFDTYSEIQNDQYIFSTIGNTDRDDKAPIHSSRVGFDYYVSSKTVIGVLGTFFSRGYYSNTLGQSLYRFEPGVDTLFVTNNSEDNLREQYMANINIQHQFDERQKLNIDLDYFVYSSGLFQDYSNKFLLENNQPVGTEEIGIDKITPINILVGKVDYSLFSSDKFSLEAGVKATTTQLKNDVETERLEMNTWKVDPVYSEYNTMDEDIFAAYSSINTKLGENVSLKAGLRYEHTITDLRDANDQGVVYRNYGYFFPSVFLMRKLNEKSSLNLAYSHRITRPSFSDLAPFVLFTDSKNFVTGNVNLLPSLTHSLKTNYTYNKLNIALEYNRISDAFAMFQASRISGTNSMLYSTVNFDQTDQFNLSLSFPIYIAEWWEMNNNLSGISRYVKSDYFNEYIEINSFWYVINSTQSFNLPKKTSIQLSGMYLSSMLEGIRKVQPFGMVSLGIRKELGENGGALNLSITDMFENMVFRSIADVPEHNIRAEFNLDFDIRNIKLTYTKSFGNNKIKSRSKRQTGSAEDLKRVGN